MPDASWPCPSLVPLKMRVPAVPQIMHGTLQPGFILLSSKRPLWALALSCWAMQTDQDWCQAEAILSWAAA